MPPSILLGLYSSWFALSVSWIRAAGLNLSQRTRRFTRSTAAPCPASTLLTTHGRSTG